MKIFYSFVFAVFLVGFLSGCVTEPARRWVYPLLADTTWVIPENDSLVWKYNRRISSGVRWVKGDTLYVEVTCESGPSIGYVVFSAGKKGDYKDIFKEDTTYSVNWHWESEECDTIALMIVNTSSQDTIEVNGKVEGITWSPEYSYMP